MVALRSRGIAAYHVAVDVEELNLGEWAARYTPTVVESTLKGGLVKGIALLMLDIFSTHTRRVQYVE